MFWKLGSTFAATSVLLGAFGSHGLKKVLDKDPECERKLANWSTAAHYQMTHALGILLVSLKHSPNLHISGYLFTVGIILFSGSIYGLVLDKHKKYSKVIAPLTPIGGFCLIGGWLTLIFA